MRKLFYLAVLAVGLSLAAACGGDDETTPATAPPVAATVAQPPPPPPPPTVAPIAPTATVESTTPSNGPIKVTSINGDPAGPHGAYVFDPGDFTFNVGDVVEFTLIAETEFHTFTVDELGIDVSLFGGSPETLLHTFDTAGEFKLICIPHEFQGMVGSITVLP